MENICVIRDFEEIRETRSFKQYPSPASQSDYKVYVGGNFIFIQNAGKVVVRFNLPNHSTTVNDELVEKWINSIRRKYPNF